MTCALVDQCIFILLKLSFKMFNVLKLVDVWGGMPRELSLDLL